MGSLFRKILALLFDRHRAYPIVLDALLLAKTITLLSKSQKMSRVFIEQVQNPRLEKAELVTSLM
jgi:hypothetical protein